MNELESIESVIGFEAIYKSERKCEHGVMRKGGVQAFSLNRLRNSIKLSDSLYDGSYKPKPTREVKITYPKPRIAYANAFIDRVYQRSLNDNAVYPQMKKGFIKENMACQKGKGTDSARELFRLQMHSMWLRHGTDFYILQGDIKKYYDNMSHDCADAVFRKGLDPWVCGRTEDVLHQQYSGDKGYRPGSQMVQIMGISYLSHIDHYIKEHLRIPEYCRYMDDFQIMHNSKEYLESCREMISDKLKDVGLDWHEKKTKIANPCDGVLFLGFVFRLTKSGKVIMTCDPKKIKANKKKLFRMVRNAKAGKISREDCDKSIECMIAHMSKGDSDKQVKKFIKYYKNLWRD